MNFDWRTEYGNEDEQHGQGTITAGPHGHYGDQMGGDRGNHSSDTWFLALDNMVGMIVATRPHVVRQAERSTMQYQTRERHEPEVLRTPRPMWDALLD